MKVVTIFKVLSTSDPGEFCYYLAFGEQMPLPDFAQLYSTDPLAFGPPLQQGCLAAASRIERFKRALKLRGCYVEFSERDAQKLVDALHAKVEEIAL